MADNRAEEWRRLARALAERQMGPSLLPGDGRSGDRPKQPRIRSGSEELPAALRIATAVLEDRLDEALARPVTDPEAQVWRAVALRRAGRFQEARQAFRSVGLIAIYLQLYERALDLLRSGGGGYRWAAETAAHLTARGRWDPVWFVDACAAVQSGLLSRESAALLEEIQRAELQLMLDTGAAG